MTKFGPPFDIVTKQSDINFDQNLIEITKTCLNSDLYNYNLDMKLVLSILETINTDNCIIITKIYKKPSTIDLKTFIELCLKFRNTTNKVMFQVMSNFLLNTVYRYIASNKEKLLKMEENTELLDQLKTKNEELVSKINAENDKQKEYVNILIEQNLQSKQNTSEEINKNKKLVEENINVSETNNCLKIDLKNSKVELEKLLEQNKILINTIDKLNQKNEKN